MNLAELVESLGDRLAACRAGRTVMQKEWEHAVEQEKTWRHEVERFKRMRLCPHCVCRNYHKQPCHCEDDS